MKSPAWDTRRRPEAGFLAEWAVLARRAPQFNFSMDAAFLQWEATQGRHAIASIVERGGRRAAVVLRRVRGGFLCGYPWRWQVALESPDAAGAMTPAVEDCAWLFREASRLAGAAQLKFFAPSPPPRGTAGFAAGATTLVALDAAEDALLTGMAGNSRRAVKKAASEGYAVWHATAVADQREFHLIQKRKEARRKGASPEELLAITLTDEPWREWEHPWMFLLASGRDGVVEAGSGFGFSPGGMADYRMNSSTDDAKKVGANPQLAHAAMLHARAQGCHLMNWGGANTFKRHLGGERFTIWCWLGGAPYWAPFNHAYAGLVVSARETGRAIRRARARARAKSNER